MVNKSRERQTSAGCRFPKQKFHLIERMNPYWSSYTCFCDALKDCPYISKKALRRSFKSLVDKDDYAESEKDEIIKHLENTFLK